MGFFSDLKEDLSQAVNELIPEEEALEGVDTQEKESVDTVAEETANEENVELQEEAQADTTPEVNEEAETVEQEGDKPEWNLADMLEENIIEDPVETNKSEFKGEERIMDSNANKAAVDETSVITGAMTINGDVESDGSVDVIGNVNGNITILGKLNVTGHVVGNSQASEIYADGAKIDGEVVSEGAVKIGQSTVIVGNITATSAVIAGAVKGDIDVKGPVVLDTSAIVMGNIKSKSVQINNGAVIEGMCSQCYADVNPTSFFEDYKSETKKNK